MNAKREERTSSYLMVAGGRGQSIIINSLNYYYYDFCFFGKSFCWHIRNAFRTNWDTEKRHLPSQELRYSTQLLPSNIVLQLCLRCVCHLGARLPCDRFNKSDALLNSNSFNMRTNRWQPCIDAMELFIFNGFIDGTKLIYENRIQLHPVIDYEYWIRLCAPLL